MRPRKDIMLAYPFEERRFDAFPKPCLVQPKYEGDRYRANFTGPQVRAYSSTGHLRLSLPHINEELQQARSYFKFMELDGEAYKHGMRHSEIRSIVSRTVNLHPDHKKMEYHVFDCMEDVGYSETHIQQHDRIRLLAGLFAKFEFKYVKLSPFEWVSTLDELQLAYEKYLKQGYEGIIIRNPNEPYVRSAPNKFRGLLKLKPRMSDSFKIVGFEEEYSIHDEPKDTLGAIILVNEEGTRFKVGTGPTDRQRDLIWQYREHLLRQPCKIRFQSFTKARGVPKMQSIDKGWLTSVERILTT